ncbi:MAG: rhomboid family intramembrane serine protease [Candidatus Tectomicrobia bacterium]|nr:rhomboid family intramembrane serine protease [Candidatus Tectomicrobia bacterium]
MNKSELKLVFSFIGILWGIHFLNIILPWELRALGLLPRTLRGLWGILFAPFLHANLAHLISNSVPLLVLSLAFLSLYRKHLVDAFIIILLIHGSGVWIFGRLAVHFGASGLLYGLITYLIIFGFLRKKPVSICLAVAVAIYYGGTLLLGILPIYRFISWEGHLFGAIGGIFGDCSKDSGSRISSPCFV